MPNQKRQNLRVLFALWLGVCLGLCFSAKPPAHSAPTSVDPSCSFLLTKGAQIIRNWQGTKSDLEDVKKVLKNETATADKE